MSASAWARIPLLLLCIAAIAGAIGFAIRREEPIGTVEGRVLLPDGKTGLSDVSVYLTGPISSKPGEGTSTRQILTSKDGYFRARRLRTGDYTANVLTQAHNVGDIPFTIAEGKSSSITIKLKRSEPNLRVGVHARMWTPREQMVLPVRGFLDFGKTTKTERLHVRVYRAKLSHLFSSDKTAEELRKLGNAYAEEDRGLGKALVAAEASKIPVNPLYEEDIPVDAADREGFFTQRIPIRTKGVGTYLVEVSRGKDTTSSWMVSTNLALILKRDPKSGALAYTANLTSGTPVSGARVRVFRQARVLADTTTATDGIASIGKYNGENAPYLFAVAEIGDDETVLRLNESNESDGQSLAHLQTDRPIYRPGHTVQYKGIARDRSPSGKAYDYTIPQNVPVAVTVRDPDGELVYSANTTTNSLGSFHGKFTLSPEAQTGSYILASNINGSYSTSEVYVASYRKPEFEATATAARGRYLRGENVEVTIEGKYYFGSPVAGGRVRYFVSREADWSAEFAGDFAEDDDMDGYGSDLDPASRWFGETVLEGETRLDENGRAVVRFPASATPRKDSNADDSTQTTEVEPPQSLKFTVHATVIDDAERESETQTAVTVTAGDTRLIVEPEGYVAEAGKETTVFVTARDWNTGKPVPGTAITVRATWPRPKTDNHSSRAGTAPPPLTLDLSGTTGTDGRAILRFTPPKSGEVRLSASTTDGAGRRVTTSSYLWIAARGLSSDRPEGDYSDLSLLTDKRRYSAGETAHVLVNSARLGQTALVTVEGDRIYDRFVVPIRQNSTLLDVPVRAEYGGNVTLAACYVRDKRFAQSQIPIRVAIPESDVRVTITPNRDKFEPRQSVSYKIRTTNVAGQPVPCELSFGLVDEGIYALRGDRPGAIKSYFYPRRYNRIMTSNSFEVEYLDGSDKAEPKIEARSRFVDTAFWNPSILTNANGDAEVTVPLPDNLTTWRATAIACSTKTQVGFARSKVLVNKPFFVRLETPRVLTQNDKAHLLVLVHNETGKEQTAQVKLIARGLSVAGADIQSVTVAPGAVGKAIWETSATKFGQAELRATAWIPGTNLTDGVVQSLGVRAYGRERLTTVSGSLSGGKSSEFTLAVDSNSVADSRRAILRITPSIGASIQNAVEYLRRYEYTCVEQTTSRFAPLAFLAGVEKRIGKSLLLPNQRDSLKKEARDQMTRLYALQQGSGGWGWWERDAPNPFMTAYAMHGLLIARQNGQPVSDKAIRDAATQVKEMLESKEVAAPDKPFLMYNLALSGDVSSATQARSKVDLAKIPAQSLAFVVLTDSLLKSKDNTAVRFLKAKMQNDGALVHWEADSTSVGNSSDPMATSFAVIALLRADPANPNIAKAIRYLMQSRTEGYWLNTRDTACVLFALGHYLEKHPADATTGAIQPGAVTVAIDGKPVKPVASSNSTGETILRLPGGNLSSGAHQIAIRLPLGTGTAFYTASLRQTVATPELPEQDMRGVTVRREYLRVQPRRVGDNGFTLIAEPVKESFAQGDRVRVKLTITAQDEIGYALIEDVFPSGLEPTERGSAETEGQWNAWYSGSQVRDDRIAFFARTLPRGKSVIEYNLRAQTPGTFTALPASAQAMYRGSLRAETSGAKVGVK